MKIIKLELLEDSILAGLDAMALVEKPATEEEFFAFSAEKFAETYSVERDYSLLLRLMTLSAPTISVTAVASQNHCGFVSNVFVPMP